MAYDPGKCCFAGATEPYGLHMNHSMYFSLWPTPRCGSLVELDPLWYYREVPPETMIMLGSVVLAIFVFSILFLWGNYMRSKRKKEELPSNWIVKKTEIKNFLQTALMQRNKIEMQFHSETVTRKVANCSLEVVENDTISLELSGRDKASEKWIGRHVDCYMRLSRSSDDMRFFYFDSEILNVISVAPGLVQLVLRFPDKLVMQQKREHLRVDPPYQYVLGVALWPSSVAKDPDLPIKDWGKPLAAFVPDKQNAVSLVNISGGGVRLQIKHELCRVKEQQFTAGEPYVVMLDLYEPENNGKNRFLMICGIRNRAEDVISRDLMLGMQFLQQARPRPDGKAIWKPVDTSEGVEKISNWVMKRHLELYRERGIA